MHRKMKSLFFILIVVMMLIPVHIEALGFVQIGACEETLLGNPQDENSIAWIIQQVLDFIKIVGPILVLVLSSVDFLQVILNGDDIAMASAQKKLITRLFLAAALFILPFLVTFLLDIFGLTGDSVCGMY